MTMRWDPFADFASMRGLSNRLFNDTAPRTLRLGAASPFPFDLFEAGDEFVLRAAIPGINTADLDLSVRENVLTLSGSRSLYPAEDAQTYTWHARGLAEGPFTLRVALPAAVESGAARASYEAGMLTVKLPKSEAVKVKKIAIATPSEQIAAAAAD
ncbi:MAG TPA: Hsp20/alpha crystallin family protein [Dehalococcoidia bacterium]|nr:Hsp20/alpha crystallin family protein [Dehalococcoidia bacterium]